MDFDGFEDLLGKFDQKSSQQDKQKDINNTNSPIEDAEKIRQRLLQDVQQEQMKKNSTATSGKSADASFHAGHRQRARERFMLNPDKTTDYDLLELILFLIIPRADTKPIARKLINKYKTIKNLFNANVDDISTCGISGTAFKYIQTLMQTWQKRILSQNLDQNSKTFDQLDDVIEYCCNSIGMLASEEFHILFFNDTLQLIADETFGSNGVASVSLNMREIVQKCIKNLAHSVILCHNHPNGELNPSPDDIQLTNSVKETLEAIDVNVIDHIIVANDNYFSFNEHGLIE